MSFDLIRPFLRPIAHLIEDAEVSEIMVNGSKRVFIERSGVMREATDIRLDERNLGVAVKNIARALGDDVFEEKPILDSRLPDGSRVAAVLAPCSLGGTTLTIRKFQTRFFTADELVRIGTLTPEVWRRCVTRTPYQAAATRSRTRFTSCSISRDTAGRAWCTN